MKNSRLTPPLVALAGSLGPLLSTVDPSRRVTLLDDDTVALGDNLELRVLLVDLLGLDARSLLLLTLEELEGSTHVRKVGY